MDNKIHYTVVKVFNVSSKCCSQKPCLSLPVGWRLHKLQPYVGTKSDKDCCVQDTLVPPSRTFRPACSLFVTAFLCFMSHAFAVKLCEVFRARPGWAQGPPSFLFNWYPVSFLGLTL